MKYILLTNSTLKAIIDDDDFEVVSRSRWNLNLAKGYAYRAIRVNGKICTVYMHRLVAKTPIGMQTDHINRDRLDNRKENLRICTNQENQMNRKSGVSGSGFIGVTWLKVTKK